MFAISLPRSTRYRLLICLFLLLCLLGAGAGVLPTQAQQPVPADPDTTTVQSPERAGSPDERKSPGLAVFYSAGGTLLLTPLLIGPVVGPSFGHFYADNNTRAWRGIGLRFAELGLAGIFGLIYLGPPNMETWALTATRVSFYGMFVHALYDIVTAWHATKDYNESIGARAQLTPTVGPQGKQIGLTLRISL